MSETAGMFSAQPGNGRVLIVENEVSVRNEVRATLEKVGYDVLEAENGERAMQMINEGENPLLLDVVITDIDKAQAMESLSFFKSQYPHVPQIVLTGFTEEKKKVTPTIKIALLGAGKGGAALLDVLSHLPSIEIVGITDQIADAPGLLRAEELNITILSNPITLISRPDVDLILDVTGKPDMKQLIEENKSPETEVLGGEASKLLWTLVQHEKEMQAQLFKSQKLAGMIKQGINGFLIKPLAPDRLVNAVAIAMEERELNKL